ncbi:mediator of RNA polymerase II transcription subunit 15a-like [Fagus crenata]
MPGISASPLHVEFTNSDGKQQTAAAQLPIEHLLKAVESVSPEALSASIQEISSVVNMVDMIDGTAIDSVSKSAVGEDLASKMRCQIQARNFSLQYGCGIEDKMKHQINFMAHDATLLSANEIRSFKQLADHLSDLGSTAKYQIKRPRIEPNNALWDEIKYINQWLVETVIDLDSMEDVSTTEAGEGTIIRCSYSAVAIGQNFKFWSASSWKLPVLSLWLLVPADYPNSSPIIFNELTIRSRKDSKESKDLSQNAKLRFKIVLHKLSEPMSLIAMARAWDSFARAVVFEYAQRIGGECFSSRYGSWDNCFTG